MVNNKKSHRFTGTTSSINVKKLERETEKLLYLGFVFAVCIHVATAILFSFEKTEPRVYKPIKVTLIITPPKLTKPFIVRGKVPQKKPLYRKDFDLRKPFRETDIQSLPPFDIHDFSDSVNIDYTMAFHISGQSSVVEESLVKTSTRRKPFYDPFLELEILSPDDLDYGKYKALIVKNPFYHRFMRGFVYIPSYVWGASLIPLKRPVLGLSEALKRYTGITPKVDKYVILSSSEIFDFPFIYIATEESFELTEIEKRNFLAYLKSGGFAVLDNGFPQEKFGSAEASLRQMLWDVAYELGGAAFISMIPLGHPIYHCFFDFYEGPPLGAELIPPEDLGIRKKPLDPVYIPVPYLEGLWINGRLAAVYSDMGYGHRWSQITNNTPQLRMGVNLVVYALLRDEAIARRYVEKRSLAIR